MKKVINQATKEGKTNPTLLRLWRDKKYNYSAEDWLNNNTGNLYKDCWKKTVVSAVSYTHLTLPTKRIV